MSFRGRLPGSFWRGIARWCCLLLGGLSAPLRGHCQDRPSLPAHRESFRVDAPLLVSKQFENVRGLLEQEQWTDAFTS
ncbi:MAG: hypothetical protein AB7Q45_16825 [Planctomycetaceae bacterium]